MRRPSALAGLTALMLSGLIATTTTGSPATAAPAAPEERAGVSSHRTGADTRAEQQAVRDYWTAARMRNATPRVVDGRATDRAVERGAPRELKGKPVANDGYLGGTYTGSGAVVATTGKVFFTLGGTNYVCSGSAVTSANKSTVTTAGHCLNEGPGAYATKFSFVPAYKNGSAPYGEWVATSLSTTSQWATAGDFDYDVGMAKVGQLNGRSLTDVVGSQGIAFNQPRGQFTYSFGYPAASPYNGQTLSYCSGTTTNDTYGGSNDLRLACNMTGGSSGGPWFQNFNTATGTGTQISVNSFGYRGEKNAMYGPYFGSVIQSLYTTVSAS